jgi:hypothetical protein
VIGDTPAEDLLTREEWLAQPPEDRFHVLVSTVETTLAWAAGLFEGEGSISTRHGRPILQLKMCDREIVERFAEAVGTPNRVLGPYKNRTGEKDGYPRKDFYVWTTGTHKSQRILTALWPWLGTYRRTRAAEVGFATPQPEVEGHGRR